MASFGVYRRLIGAQIRSQLTYRVSFLMSCVGDALAQATELVAILAIFSRVTDLGGFSREEVLLMYALASTSFGLADLAVGQLDRLPQYLRTGKFDSLLIRPLGSLGQLMVSDFQLRRLGRICLGIGILAYVVSTVDIQWGWHTALLLVISPIAGAVLMSAVWVMAASLCFWLIEGAELTNGLTYGGHFLASYPITIYPAWLRTALAFVVPAAFIAYFPALALLGKPDPLGTPAFLGWISPVVAALALGLAALVWRAAVRHYRGTGS
ncbi:ABC-2 family transporter protein [Crossiella sp. SN42]|uniref:ABC transporter permease n=1 Tax=Crossiella sp. SN42 TaxID=2944808 RepID=UPI00207CAEA6|nr:ABC-2 family transporter protein [Crossiella sp. SN42]MCO1582642.1 ABC-2 family transporter protein [Crossiella sp. SN42]